MNRDTLLNPQASSCARPHSETKQTEPLEFQVEKGLLQGRAERLQVACVSENPELLEGFQQSIYLKAGLSQGV